MATIVKIRSCTRNAFLLEEGYPTTSQAFRTKSTTRVRHVDVDVMRNQYGSTNSPRFGAETRNSFPHRELASQSRQDLLRGTRFPLLGHAQH
ncbi:hypothetical protein Q067_00622 [Pseudomonas aeruginosa BL13]|nr:hypothetical protein Q067_00622 [Pseudomonas aeruginosa BL13]